MAIDLIELAATLRLGDGVNAPVEPLASILLRLRRAAIALIEDNAPGAPEAIKDEACVRLVATGYDQPNASSGSGYAAAWRNSGAESLVSRWVVRRTAGASAEGGETPDDEEPVSAQPVRLLGWSDDETIGAADLAAAGVESFEDALPIPQFASDQAYLWGATWASDTPTSVGSSAGELTRRDDVTYDGIVWAVFRAEQLIQTRLADFGLLISFRYNGIL